ncbi:hypothetical protein HYDPIDRAFT_112181 [Hydnomerulius pinastri MD-312]|uniref:Uncharacterized protein n=1 Tax=Hydnomerulius pinastri MD-312 TaxID=994086 RepID=A0A0C9W0F2_9AGAM|nr:hypothetical protein HYDPIDRAFT_112181 [Hydnomerulius pinastri MD-312]
MLLATVKAIFAPSAWSSIMPSLVMSGDGTRNRPQRARIRAQGMRHAPTIREDIFVLDLDSSCLLLIHSRGYWPKSDTFTSMRIHLTWSPWTNDFSLEQRRVMMMVDQSDQMHYGGHPDLAAGNEACLEAVDVLTQLHLLWPCRTAL